MLHQFEYRDQAPLFRRMSESYELCVFQLNLVKYDLESLRSQQYGSWRALLEGN